MKVRIENLKKKKLIGTKLTMSLINNRTGELWQEFIPKCREISNHLTNDFISMQIYNPTYFSDFKPTNEFEKWATVEVTNFKNVPTGMETFLLTGGLNAVFEYKGVSNDLSIFKYIFGTWIQNSEYFLDNRPHFEVLGNKYKNNDPNSEEEIWIPIKTK